MRSCGSCADVNILFSRSSVRRSTRCVWRSCRRVRQMAALTMTGRRRSRTSRCSAEITFRRRRSVPDGSSTATDPIASTNTAAETCCDRAAPSEDRGTCDVVWRLWIVWRSDVRLLYGVGRKIASWFSGELTIWTEEILNTMEHVTFFRTVQFNLL